MKKTLIVLMVFLIFGLAGCGIGQDNNVAGDVISAKTVYHSDISAEDCYLCGGGIENLVPSYWGQNNVALISLNTFKIKPIEINRYQHGQLIEGYAGTVSFCGGGSEDGGFSATLLLNYDRGYATGSVDFSDDETLKPDEAASFLCADCLNEILTQNYSRCFGVGVINLDTKEIRLFEESSSGFDFGDFHISLNLKERKNSDSQQVDLLIFYCPLRYQPES